MATQVKNPVSLIDPSQLLRPEPTFRDKPLEAFRDYSVDDADPIKERVRRTYEAMHTYVTVDLVKQKREKWLKFNHFQSTVKDALVKLNELVDESDPDTDLPNIVHAFQTAERIRQDHPDEDWFQLTGLIHDLGKVMAFYDEPQWCVVGDTFPVGCKWGESIVYGPDSFRDNPDTHDPRYNTKYGMYEPHCGLDRLLISWSHDEYMYQFLRHNRSALPEKALYMIRSACVRLSQSSCVARYRTGPKMKFKNPDNSISLTDPSLLLRPERVYRDKPLDCFRDYSVNAQDPVKERVRCTYYTMHTHMTVDFVKSKMEKWLKFNHFKSTVKDALVKLNELVDESDPDTDLPNIVHAFQTAERIREDYPEDDWFHLIGLIHDLGKVMAFYDEPQWCVVGDTFPVGCKWGENIVYGDDSFKDNPDTYNKRYNTELGMYDKKCGIENLLMSWGHDEYLYRVLKHNNAKCPEEGLQMIRFHSFYPWHAGGDYSQFVTEEDEKIKQAVLKFNKYDLYTKNAAVPDIEALWPYYEVLIEKYIPGELAW